MLLGGFGSRAAALGLAWSISGCSSPTPGNCLTSYDGQPSAPIAGELVGADQSGDRYPLTDGGPLYLSAPPQGGYIFYAGALVKNLDPCVVTSAAELLSPDGGGALTNFDSRQAAFDQMIDGFAAPGDLFSGLPNIPACPDALGGEIAGTPAILRVTVTDEQGKTATFTQNVLPTCRDGDTDCLCSCGGRCD